MTFGNSSNNVVGEVTQSNTYQHVDENDISNLNGVEPFGSLQEQVNAMRSPQYRQDAAFRNLVARRIAKGGLDTRTIGVANGIADDDAR